jgi:CubicO group peptidase (beta-lactamase class C family)
MHLFKCIRRIAVVLAIVLASAQATNDLRAQSLAPGVLRAVDSTAAAEFARDSIASLTIGVVTDQGLVWTKSYGFADMGTRRLANRQSVYRIGSVTKMFTALMLHQLDAAGKVRLSDPVERYYPEIKAIQGYSTLTAPITFLQLASMTSGIAREPKEEGPFWTGPVSQWDSTLRLALPHTAMELAPGTRFLYSNIGYAILGASLSRAAGVPFVQWQREHILDPLGMRHTAFELDRAITADLTRGYAISQDGDFTSTQSDREALSGRGYKVPNGALYTTVDDLSRFLSLQLGHGPKEVVSPARLDSAYNGALLGGVDPKREYGIGFSIEPHGTSTWFGHGGAVAGFSATVTFDRDHQVGVIVLRNALGGRVRPPALASFALQRVVDAKVAAEKGSGAPAGRHQRPEGDAIGRKPRCGLGVALPARR